MTFRPRKTTATTLIVELLKARDDFMSRRMIQLALRGQATNDQIASALVWLRDMRAIDCIIEPDGVAWWFNTPWSDQRQRVMDEMAIHERPGARKPRGKRRRKEEPK